jgi:hypothetical protein
MPELDDVPILAELGEQLKAGFRRREERRRPTTVRLGVLAAAATVAAVAGLAWGVAGGGVSSSQAAAAQLLRTAANAVVRQRVRVPAPGQFFFMRYLTATVSVLAHGGSEQFPVLRPSANAHGPTALVTTVSWESSSVTRYGKAETRFRSIAFSPPESVALQHDPGLVARLVTRVERTIDGSGIATLGPLGRRIYLAPHRTLTLRELYTLPADATATYRLLFAQDSATEALGAIESLDYYPLPARVQGTVYRALALVRGIRAEGRARDLAGRPAILLGAPDTSAGVEGELLLDPRTGVVLASRSILTKPRGKLRAGTVLDETATIELRVTNSPWPPGTH